MLLFAKPKNIVPAFEVFQEDELNVDVDVEVEVVTEQIEDRIPESAHVRFSSNSFQFN